MKRGDEVEGVGRSAGTARTQTAPEKRLGPNRYRTGVGWLVGRVPRPNAEMRTLEILGEPRQAPAIIIVDTRG